MGVRLSEHESRLIQLNDLLPEEIAKFHAITSKRFNSSSYCFLFEKKEQSYQIKADYCVGIDWIGNTGRYLYVEPKINTKNINHFKINIDTDEADVTNIDAVDNQIFELDYLNMLLQITSVQESNLEMKDLVQIDWEVQPIAIEQKDDKLTPFLIIRFLQLLKTIVKKGLKKSYYKVQENLNNKVKGKILVGQHIKENVLKNRLTSTYCDYQLFGEDHIENQFLKHVLQFVNSYVVNHKFLLARHFDQLNETINYCRPAFEMIATQSSLDSLKHIKFNPFYREYIDALQIGNHILKRFSYNISQTANHQIKTPPFWIDMPRLFELYVYSKMITDNQDSKQAIHYQFSTYGNALDVLVSHPDYCMVIDAKYKLKYLDGHLHQDIRQVAGYARLHKVREQLKATDDSNIDCLIIYPDMDKGIDDFSLENIKTQKQVIKPYYKVYKLGVKLPFI